MGRPTRTSRSSRRSPPVSQNPSSRKRWLLALKLLIVALVVGWVAHALSRALGQLDDHAWQLKPAWLLAAGGCYLLGLLPAAIFWQRVLRVLGQDAKLGETLRAYYIGHLGKYVPGKAMVVVIRAGLIRSRRVNTAVAAVSVFFETLTMMAVGAFIAAAILAAEFRDQRLLFLLAVALMVAAGVPTFPPVFKRLVRLFGVGKSDTATADKLESLGYGTLLSGWIAMAVGWGLLGLSLWATLRAMGVADVHLLWELPRYVASVCLAMVAGFLSLIPGGIGVRDMVLAELMAPRYGVVVALASAVLLRLVWLVSELIVSSILYVGGARTR